MELSLLATACQFVKPKFRTDFAVFGKATL